jgi:AcrR family transcriptional regulator
LQAISMAARPKPARSIRASQLEATRRRILDAAVASLIKQGTAATTTVAVQQRAGVSRGALLHHFPTHAELLAATIDELVRRNEAAVHNALADLLENLDPVDRATRVLADAFSQPAYLTELELWAVARTDPQLRAALRAAERRARRDFDRVVNDLFAPLRDRPGCATVVMLSSEFVRGFALASVLRSDPVRRARLLESWIWAIRILLDQPSSPTPSPIQEQPR